MTTMIQRCAAIANAHIFLKKDKRTIGLKEKFTKWGSAEDAFQFWAKRLSLFMDKVHDRNS